MAAANRAAARSSGGCECPAAASRASQARRSTAPGASARSSTAASVSAASVRVPNARGAFQSARAASVDEAAIRALPGVIVFVRDGSFLGLVAEREIDAIRARLARLDAKTPWTAETLALIGKHPRVAASRLAATLGREGRPGVVGRGHARHLLRRGSVVADRADQTDAGPVVQRPGEQAVGLAVSGGDSNGASAQRLGFDVRLGRPLTDRR